MVRERLPRGGDELLLVNMHVSAKSNDRTPRETQARSKRLIVQQSIPNMERLEITQILSE